jgi:hypothetical protein
MDRRATRPPRRCSRLPLLGRQCADPEERQGRVEILDRDRNEITPPSRAGHSNKMLRERLTARGDNTLAIRHVAELLRDASGRDVVLDVSRCCDGLPQGTRTRATGRRRASRFHSRGAGTPGRASSRSRPTACAQNPVPSSPGSRSAGHQRSPPTRGPVIGLPASARRPPMEEEMTLKRRGRELVPRGLKRRRCRWVDPGTGDFCELEQVVVRRKSQLQARCSETKIEQWPWVRH